MKTITGTATWSATASVPVAGERPAKSIHIESPVQTVLNNTAYVKAAVETEATTRGAADTALSGRVAFLETLPPVTFAPMILCQTNVSDYPPTAIVDTIDNGTIVLGTYAAAQSSIMRLPAIGAPLQTGLAAGFYEALNANAGLIKKAVCNGSIAGGIGTIACLSDVSGTYYFVSMSNNRVHACDYNSRASTTRATSAEPNSPQLLVDPATAGYWARIGQYVINGALTINEDCGCGAPATSKPCMGAYNGNVVVGYYGGSSNQCDFRYKVGAGSWTQGGIMFHSAGIKYLSAITYDPARAVWDAVLSNGEVWSSSNLANAWETLSYGTFPTTLYGRAFTSIQKAWIFGQRVVVWAVFGTYHALVVSADSGATWSVISVQNQSGISYGAQMFFGGKRLYWDYYNTLSDPGTHALLGSQRLVAPYAGDWP